VRDAGEAKESRAEPEAERRRPAVDDTRGMLSHLASGRSLVDEMIADRRAEARAEDREFEEEAQQGRGRPARGPS
jgi:hypothetical protein